LVQTFRLDLVPSDRELPVRGDFTDEAGHVPLRVKVTEPYDEVVRVQPNRAIYSHGILLRVAIGYIL
jgi:hypothetical protein